MSNCSQQIGLVTYVAPSKIAAVKSQSRIVAPVNVAPAKLQFCAAENKNAASVNIALEKSAPSSEHFFSVVLLRSVPMNLAVGGNKLVRARLLLSSEKTYPKSTPQR